MRMPKSEDASQGSPLRSSPEMEISCALIDQTEVPPGHVLTNYAAGKIDSFGRYRCQANAR